MDEVKNAINRSTHELFLSVRRQLDIGGSGCQSTCIFGAGGCPKIKQGVCVCVWCLNQNREMEGDEREFEEQRSAWKVVFRTIVFFVVSTSV